MSFVLRVERYSEALALEIAPLLELHWREIAHYQSAIPLEVDWGQYKRADATQRMVVVTARQDERLIGYSVFFLVHSPHYRTVLWGMNDVLYVLPEFRQSRVGLQLIRESERQLREVGCRRISWHAKPFNADGSDNPLYKILERMGYTIEEHVLGKLI